jgi:hypothetical protein
MIKIKRKNNEAVKQKNYIASRQPAEQICNMGLAFQKRGHIEARVRQPRNPITRNSLHENMHLFSSTFRKALKREQIEDFRFHDLRYSG